MYNKTFKNRIDNFFKLIAFTTIIIFLAIIFIAWWYNQQTFGFNLWLSLLLISVIGIIVWTFLDTFYTLTDTQFKYKSGFLSGSIPIQEIRELDVNKSLWAGIKPATARKGIIVKFNQWDQIYISPKSNEEFVEEILKINSKIKVNRY